ncbi:hypothetical protein SELMODRAFT_414386 [Selaginella moellendorffii]|uniref:Uncharacterized protein n=1 Tax=Selaginella moellendorffii TaxID=88036 RepID=D8RSK9_SELML|nr:hypothetical protein SELMODRAFT_414386 [Selaginella moellendorffii]
MSKKELGSGEPSHDFADVLWSRVMVPVGVPQKLDRFDDASPSRVRCVPVIHTQQTGMPPKAFEDYSLQQLWALQHKFNKQLHDSDALRPFTFRWKYAALKPLKNSLDKRILGVNEQGYDSFHEGDVQETAAYEERHFNDKIVTCDFIGDTFKRDRDGGSAKMAKRHLYTGSSPARYGSIIKGRRHLIGHHAAAHQGLARAAASIPWGGDSSPQELDYR